MGTGSLSPGAWLLLPFIGRHVKAAVDDFWGESSIIEWPAEARKSYIDVEVLQRLLK